jgi:dihydropyrimidinase
LLGRGLVEADLLVDQGRIHSIVATNAPVAAKEIISIRNLAVLPGVIDPHIHLGYGTDISRPREARDAETESAAAAKGGVTTFIAYVLATEDYADLFASLQKTIEAGSCVDFGLHFVLATKQHLGRIGHYVRDLGVPTLKLFMSSRGNEGQRLGLPPLDDGFAGLKKLEARLLEWKPKREGH